MAKKKKIRLEFRKNQQSRTRKNDLTKRFDQSPNDDGLISTERISGKGNLTRKRTVIGLEAEGAEQGVVLEIDANVCRAGRVLSAHGLTSTVRDEQGQIFECATSRVLKSLSTDQRHAVVTGDCVWFRPMGETEGMIERVEPRRSALSRASRGRKHVIVSNVDQLLIVVSVAEPALKPHLIDRYLISAEQGRLDAIICLNKIDLVDVAELQPLVGVFSQMGYRVVLSSAQTGQGVAELRRMIQGKETVLSGQSGVGKSSLLNAVQPGLGLRVSHVSADNQKGRHTTTVAQLIPLEAGGYMVDTPGIRAFELWDVSSAEVSNFFRDLRPFINHCRFPNCTHRHEADCAVKDAVADDLLDARRYESYLHVYDGTMPPG